MERAPRWRPPTTAEWAEYVEKRQRLADAESAEPVEPVEPVAPLARASRFPPKHAGLMRPYGGIVRWCAMRRGELPWPREPPV